MGKKTILQIAVLPFFIFISYAQVGLKHLATENLINPIGLDVPQPRFSWKLESDKRNVSQTAYEIIVSEDKKAVWKSGKIASIQSVEIPYNGSALQSGKKYSWSVRIWDNENKASGWSEPGTFQMAFLNMSDLPLPIVYLKMAGG